MCSLKSILFIEQVECLPIDFYPTFLIINLSHAYFFNTQTYLMFV